MKNANLRGARACARSTWTILAMAPVLASLMSGHRTCADVPDVPPPPATLPSEPPPPPALPSDAAPATATTVPANSSRPASEPFELPLGVPDLPTRPRRVAAGSTTTFSGDVSATQPVAVPSIDNITPDRSGQLRDVVVSAEQDRSRDAIFPPLGATTYSIGPNQIENTPGGENATFQQTLLRAPGVAEDSFGQLHVRGEHNNLTYRLNGILLPEGLNGFGQELDTRLVNSVTLIDGSLPAQFGFRTAGIVDVTTKSGATLNNNELSLYGGSLGTYEPSLQLGGTEGNFDYFLTASFRQTGLGIENPTDSYDAIHDSSQQEKFFSYLAWRLDETSRISLLLNASYADFQIPNTPGLPAVFGLANHPDAAQSRYVDENQNEQDYYAVLAYQKTTSDVSFQLAGYTRYGQIDFNPDPVKDLIFTGVAGHVFNSFWTNGVQFDLSSSVDPHHTLRAGLLADYTQEQLFTDTAVFAVDATGAQAANASFSIHDDSRNWGAQTGLYIQDEWRISDKLTLNYGLRYDRFDANFENNDQVSPRANLVYKLDSKTTLHAGYSRYFAPPPVQYVHPQTIARFAGTTNGPALTGDAPTPSERSHYFDVGVTHQVTQPWTINFDTFYKDATNLNDLGQFGSALILSPYAYRRGHVYGNEVSTTYTLGGLSLFGNFSYTITSATRIISSQYQFDPDELAYIDTHDVHLDHDSEFTASAGISYMWKHDRLYADILYGSGLRSGFANIDHVRPLYPVNIGYEHVFRDVGRDLKDIRFRVDVVNVFDQIYEIRDGSGIGVGASQYGERRGIFAGLTFDF